MSRIRFVDAQGNDVLHPKNYVSKNDKHFRQTVKVEFKDGLPANITSFFIVVEGIVGGELMNTSILILYLTLIF